jgi:carboxylesterase
MSATSTRLLAGAEPFEHAGASDVGVLLVHGYTGSPREMMPIGEALAARGIGSSGILLRGHGTHPDEMIGWHYSDWIADAERGLNRLLERHQRAVVVGLSMGGTLTLNVASRRAADPRVVGLVTICAPVVIRDWRLSLLGVISRFVKWHAWGPPEVRDRSAWDQYVGYRRFRATTLRQMLDLMADTRSRLSAIHQPILVVHADSDGVVPADNAELIQNGVSSTDRRVLELQDCYHVATLDFATDQLNDEVVRFVEHLATAGQATAAPAAGGPIQSSNHDATA